MGQEGPGSYNIERDMNQLLSPEPLRVEDRVVIAKRIEEHIRHLNGLKERNPWGPRERMWAGDFSQSPIMQLTLNPTPREPRV